MAHPISWTTAFLDLPAEGYDESVAFWCGVTGHGRSAARGEHGEFASLVPPEGDEHLRVQRLGTGGPRIHLDLHVADPRGAADAAGRLGAVEVADRGYVVMTSPGGLTFCFVSHPATTTAPAAQWGDGLASAIDQVCLDIPITAYDVETAFWRALTGWRFATVPSHHEFERLHRPAGQPFGLLLQRLEEPDGPVRAHLDLATTDRARETGRHLDLGARLVRAFAGWTVLSDPSGAPYCVTDRLPETRVPDVSAPD